MDRTVEFIKNHSPYVVWDIAGFDEKEATWLEKAGVVKRAKEGGKNATNNSRKGENLSESK